MTRCRRIDAPACLLSFARRTLPWWLIWNVRSRLCWPSGSLDSSANMDYRLEALQVGFLDSADVLEDGRATGLSRSIQQAIAIEACIQSHHLMTTGRKIGGQQRSDVSVCPGYQYFHERLFSRRYCCPKARPLRDLPSLPPGSAVIVAACVRSPVRSAHRHDQSAGALCPITRVSSWLYSRARASCNRIPRPSLKVKPIPCHGYAGRR